MLVGAFSPSFYRDRPWRWFHIPFDQPFFCFNREIPRSTSSPAWIAGKHITIMATRSSLILLLAALHPLRTWALQVTPNSGCASVCIDSPGLDLSDPNSSSTTGDDITCVDKAYAGSPFGQKFQKCVSCLQNSTAVQGHENDQMWFLCKWALTKRGFRNGFQGSSTGQ